MTMHICLQGVMSTYLDALGDQELFSWTFVIEPHTANLRSGTCAGSLGLFGPWNVSAGAGRQGGHITAVYQPRSPMCHGCNKSTGLTIQKVSTYS